MRLSILNAPAIMLIGASLPAAEPAASATPLPNLVRNPSFEQRTGGQAAEWNFTHRPKSTDPARAAEYRKQVVFSLTGGGFSGESAASIAMTGVPHDRGYTCLEQAVPVRPNARYYFSARVKSEGSGWSSIMLIPLTAQWQGLPPTEGKVAGMAVPPESALEYVPMRCQIQTGPGTAFLRIELRAIVGTMRVIFDDVKLLEIPEDAD